MNLSTKAIFLNLILIGLVSFLANNATAQIFEETFNEPNGSTSGFDDQGGVPWTSSCTGCVAGDYWEVVNGAFENQDSNGPAVWETTADIDISSCTNFEIRVHIEEDDDLEDCGTGCNSVDFVQLEYNLDNTGWVTPSNAYFCAGPCADVDAIWSDDLPAGGMDYSTGCIAGGSTLRIRITTQTWAGSEPWRIDDVTVDCGSDPFVDAGADQNTCFGQTVTLNAIYNDSVDISWNQGVTDGIAFSPSPGSNYYVVTADYGICSSQDSALVTVVDGPQFTLQASPSASCTPPYSGIITISGFTPGSMYDLTFLDPNLNNVGPTTYTANGSGQIVLLNMEPGYYTNFLIDSSGCISVNTTGITVDPPISPTVDAGPDQTVCEGDGVTLTAFNPDMASISWDNGVTDGVQFFPAAGVVMYHVTADIAGCTSEDSAQVTVIPVPTVNVPNAGPFAEGSGIQTLTATPAGGTWSASCGTCIDANTGDFDPMAAGIGQHTVCYTAGTAPCEDSMCVYIYVNDGCAMVGTVTGSNPTCFGFSDGSATINVQFGTGNLTFVITDSSGAVVNVGNSNTANNLSEGWYYFSVTDELPCTIVDSIYLEDPGQMEVTLSLTQPSCYGVLDGMAVADTVINYTGDYYSITYIWTPNSGQNGIGEDTLFNAGGSDYVLLLTDENGCSEQIDFDIPFPDSLYFTQLGTDPAYCRLYHYQSGNGVVYAAASGGTPDYDYQWVDLDDPDTTNNTTWGGQNPGLFEITVWDDNGCMLIDTIRLDSVNPEAVIIPSSAQFTANYEGTAPVEVEFCNESMYFEDPLNPNDTGLFLWNYGFEEPWTISHDVTQCRDTTYTSAGTYEACLVAINTNGCADTACVDIVIYDLQSFTPINIFTPNGDGTNDLFSFEEISVAIEEFYCLIVNRWGRKITELNAITEYWDGTDKSGSECKDGVYFYTYRAVAQNGEVIEGQGTVQLIRE